MVELRFPAPNRPVSINEKMHWAALRRRLAPWRTLTGAAWRAAGSPRPGPCEVRVTLPFARAARRDPHNYVAPLVKALIDELVKVGCWPDDTPEFVTVVEPTFAYGTDQVLIQLLPR